MLNDSISDTVFEVIHSYKMAMRSALNANEIGLNGMSVKCLTFINKSKNCTANDIVIFLNRDKAQIARLLKEMIANDWVIKSANPEDKRSQLLSLTQEGEKLAKLIAVTHEKVYKQMQENISFEELNAFKQTAAKLAENLQRFEMTQ